MNHFRGVEQLAARQAHNLKVAGSSPAPATLPARLPGSVLTRTGFYAALAIGAAFLGCQFFHICRIIKFVFLKNVNQKRL